jgi:hypothetical protein
MLFNFNQFNYDPETGVLAADAAELRISPTMGLPKTIHVQGHKTVCFHAKGFDGAAWVFEPDFRAGPKVSQLVIFND